MRPLRDAQVDLCGRVDFVRGPGEALLGREDSFTFACNGCGDCCRGRGDIVLSGYDLYRIAARLRLLPRIVARGFCRESIGKISGLPVLRLAPVAAERGSCPFLTGGRCAIHDAEPLVCALYPLGQEITRGGELAWFAQAVDCGGAAQRATVGDYLARYDLPAREGIDRRWAAACLALEDEVAALKPTLAPALARRMDAKLWQALYYRCDPAAPYLPQLEQNLAWLSGELRKLAGYQERLAKPIEKCDG